MNLSVLIIVKNEQDTIVDCLEGVSFASEIIVVDDHSTDNTVALAKQHGAKVLHYLGNDDFSKRRNFGLEKAIGDWVLYIDADERVSAPLKKEIETVITKTDAVGYYIGRQDYLWGRALHYGETVHTHLLRLARKNAGEWKGTVHETWIVPGRTALLTVPLDHYPHQTLTEFLGEINHYTDLRATELFEQKTPVSWLDIILYPKAKFFLNYVVRQGFRDGIPGLVLAILMSLHSFLVRAKLWQKNQTTPSSALRK